MSKKNKNKSNKNTIDIYIKIFIRRMSQTRQIKQIQNLRL